MKSASQRLVDAIDNKIGKRKLVWFGTRGTDSRPLLKLRSFSGLFSLIAPLESIALPGEVCLEKAKSLRVDLDSYRIDDDSSPEALALHQQLYVSLAEEAYLASYRPSNFLTSIYFPRSRYVEYLGLFHEVQNIFEHKPWVETELRKIGVNTIPWTYLGDNDLDILVERLRSGPQVIRSSRSDGGAGLVLIDDPADIGSNRVPHFDHFIGIAPYFANSIPLNVNAVAFRNSSIVFHPLSLQLIGIPGLTNRRFGYCGNDFARISDLSENLLSELEGFVEKSGKWLVSRGYVGAFGVDALIAEGHVLITEINPRFQGSSDLSSWIDQEMERPDMFLNHIAAFLDLEPQIEKIHLSDLAREQKKISQIICHNVASSCLRRSVLHPTDSEAIDRFELLPRETVAVAPEAILFRGLVYNSVTENGSELNGEYMHAVGSAVKHLFENMPQGSS